LLKQGKGISTASSEALSLGSITSAGSALLILYIRIHFTGEPGISCPRECTAILFRLPSILALALKNEAFCIT